MNVTLWNIPSVPGGDPPGAAEIGRRSPDRPEDAAKGRPTRGGKRSEPVAERSSEESDLRHRILALQREVGRAQRVLGGLEGLEELLSGASTDGPPVDSKLDDYVARLTYRGEAVLEPFREQLDRILQAGDDAALQGLIEDSRNRLGLLAQELSRYETERQNNRAISASGDSLQLLKEQIQTNRGRFMEVKPENVLRLLG
jgi:hypothetical protein